MVSLAQPFSLWNPLSRDRRFGEPAPAYVQVPLVEKTAQTTLSRVKEPAGTKLSSKMVTALSVTDVSASLVRHILQATPSVGPKHSSVSGLGCLSSGIGVLLGSSVTVGSGISDFHKAHSIGDGEGMRRSGSQIVSGAVGTNSSALYLAHETAAASLSGITVAADVLCGVGSVINMGISGVGVYRCARFRSRIDGHMETKALPEKERVAKTLRFLKEKIVPTEPEIARIAEEVKARYPDWSEKARADETKKQILDLGEVKFRYFKRRTCQATAARALKEIDKHLSGLQYGRPNALEEAKSFIQEVKKRNLQKIILTSIVLATSLIAFAGLIAGTFFSMGSLPFILYAISSAIALAILLYPLVVENLGASKAAAMQSRAVALAPTVLTNTSSN